MRDARSESVAVCTKHVTSSPGGILTLRVHATASEMSVIVRILALLLLAGSFARLEAQNHCGPILFSGATVTDMAASGGSPAYALLRQIDGTFTRFQIPLQPPFDILAQQDNALDTILPCGVKASPGAPFGSTPALVKALGQTGAASQAFAFGLLPGGQWIVVRIPVTGVGVATYLLDASQTVVSTATYPAGALPVSALLADVNGDSIPDMIVADIGSNSPGQVLVFLGAAGGTFKLAATYPAHTAPISIAAGDFNGDGKLDLAVANNDSGDISIFLNQGDGAFQPARNLPATTNPASVAAADFNNDGKLDLVVADNSGAVVILKGNGDGTFETPPAPVATGLGATTYVATGDFNGDGYIDAAVASSDSNAVSVLLGQGDGTLTLGASYVAGLQPSSLIVTDLNNDGKQDIVAGSGTPFVIAGDQNSSTVTVLLGNGDGAFSGSSLMFASPEGSTSFVLAADFTGDGKPDAVINDQTGGKLYLFAGLGGTNFAAPAVIANLNTSGNPANPSATVVAGADFDDDGKLDLAVTDTASNTVAILLNAGNGTFDTPSTFSSGGVSPVGIASADFNGDGDADLAVINDPSANSSTGNAGAGTLAIFAGGGNGAFNLLNTYPAGLAPSSLAAADLNGDGKPDLVVTDAGSYAAASTPGSILVYLNAGAGVFLKPVSYSAGLQPGALAVGDLNGDGKPDIVAGALGPGSHAYLAVLLNNGSGGFQPATLIPVESEPTSIVIRDFNGDGKADLLAADCCGANGLISLEGNGDGTFQPPISLPGGPAPWALATADLNGDGKPDVIVAQLRPGITAMLDLSPAPAFTVNAASFAAGQPVAPSSIVSAFGSHLATTTELPPPPLGTSVAGVTVSVTDSAGATRPADLFFVSPSQVNYLIPSGAAPGPATFTVQAGDRTLSGGALSIANVAPGIFTANSQGLAAATLLRVHADGSQLVASMEQLDPSTHQIVPIPIDLDPSSDAVYLELYGTGIRGAPQSQVSVQIGGMTLKPTFAGAQPAFTGLDQVNVELPYALKGSGNIPVVVTAGQTANTVRIAIQ